MKRFTVSKARERLADVLTEADRTGSVMIERGDAQYVITRNRTPRRRTKERSVIEILDPAVAQGDWQWSWTSRGLKFAARSRR